MGVAEGSPCFESKKRYFLLLFSLLIGTWVSKMNRFCPRSDRPCAWLNALLPLSGNAYYWNKKPCIFILHWTPEHCSLSYLQELLFYSSLFSLPIFSTVPDAQMNEWMLPLFWEQNELSYCYFLHCSEEHSLSQWIPKMIRFRYSEVEGWVACE